MINDAFNRVINIIYDNVDFINCKLETGTKFETLDIDSITFIKIIISIEREFNFEFDDDFLSLSLFPTISSLCDYIIYMSHEKSNK